MTEQGSVPVPSAPVRSVPADADEGGLTPVHDDAVEQALSVLDGLDDQPLRAHVSAFEAVHGALQDRLADAEG